MNRTAPETARRERLAERSRQKLERLLELLRAQRTLLIVMQDNPDPDSIAAAAALRRLANTVDVQCSIAYGGAIGRAENQAMTEYLGLNFRPLSDVEIGRYDAVALVDTQPMSGNNSLPADVMPDIVLDHHPLRSETRAAQFRDVRSRYGALCTMLFEYLCAAELQPPPPLATGLLYAIRTDTRDLGQDATAADAAAVEALYPLANTRMLSSIQHGVVRSGYFANLVRGLVNARLIGHAIVSSLGRLEVAEMTAELAELLLRHERAHWALCYGFGDDHARLSLRSDDPNAHAGELMRTLVADIGSGGGHRLAAGGKVPMRRSSQTERQRISRTLRSRLRAALSLPEGRGRRIVDADATR